MNRTDRIFFYLLLLVPFVSSILSTIHIIDLALLGNAPAMAFAVAITFEVSSVISFAATGGNVLKHVNKGWLYFIFIMLFTLQSVGNIYSGFNYINNMLVTHKDWLNNFMEMTFNYFTVSEVKLVIATLIGLPLPIISLIMLKFAIDKASLSAFTSNKESGEPIIEKISPDEPDLASKIESIKAYPGFLDAILEKPTPPSSQIINEGEDPKPIDIVSSNEGEKKN